MDSKIASDERFYFAERLRSALENAGQLIGPSSVARAYNLRANGAAVTSHAVRKWLRGEAVPTQEKILILAKWLHVHASWLRFGEADNAMYQTVPVDEALSNQDLLLINDIRELHPQAQELVRDMVDSLMRIAVGSRKSDPGQVFGRHEI